MAILLTDGRSDDEEATWREAIALREAGVEVMTLSFIIRDERVKRCKNININRKVFWSSELKGLL